jgi:hypothetical protein
MERSDIQQFRGLSFFKNQRSLKYVMNTSAKTIAENNRKQKDKSWYYLSKDGCIMICLIHYKVIKAVTNPLLILRKPTCTAGQYFLYREVTSSR